MTTNVTATQALFVPCPACHAPANSPCTKPTSTGRTAVTWVHHSRKDAWVAHDEVTDSNYFLVFGVQYYDEPHPEWPECNPKGWVRIVAPSYEMALAMAYRRFGPHWSTLVPEANFNARLFTAGELMVLP